MVCLNPGDKLQQTLTNILGQTYTDYEIVIKDSLSGEYKFNIVLGTDGNFMIEQPENYSYLYFFHILYCFFEMKKL